ncbi:hydrolase 76 protein [Rhizoclosmatium sp. JEL0117]|nr:hydrolase 76 protein [Rhizoclosmatium sp. JEL0117]
MKWSPTVVTAAAIAVSVASAQQTVNFSDLNSIMNALTAAMGPLAMYFDANSNQGAWIEKYIFSDGKSHDGVQWHESGMYWDLFYQYMQLSPNDTYVDWVDGYMQTSIGLNADYLDGNSVATISTGRWNDDIAWWGLAIMTAAEATNGLGKVNPKVLVENGAGNPLYLSVANNTYYEMFYSWDDTCGGGIFWSINHSFNPDHPNQQYYKSAITNAQHMELGARLYRMTKDPSYIVAFDRVNTWIKNTPGLFDPRTFSLTDGIDNRNCQPTDFDKVTGAIIYRSYHTAVLDEAHSHFAWLDRTFTRDGGVLYDPSDATKPDAFLWHVYKGLADLYTATTDATVKARVAVILQMSAVDLFGTCDAAWNCMRKLDVSVGHTLLDGTSVRDQFSVVAVLEAVAVVAGVNVKTKVVQAPLATATVGSDSGGGKGGNTLLYVGVGVGAAAVLIIAVIGVLVWKRKKAAVDARGHFDGDVKRREYEDGEMYTRGQEYRRQDAAKQVPRGLPQYSDKQQYGANPVYNNARKNSEGRIVDVPIQGGPQYQHSPRPKSPGRIVVQDGKQGPYQPQFQQNPYQQGPPQQSQGPRSNSRARSETPGRVVA